MHMLDKNPNIRKRVRKQYLYNPGASSFDLKLNDYANEENNYFFMKHGAYIIRNDRSYTTKEFKITFKKYTSFTNKKPFNTEFPEFDE